VWVCSSATPTMNEGVVVVEGVNVGVDAGADVGADCIADVWWCPKANV
jgi:hypothetical protein